MTTLHQKLLNKTKIFLLNLIVIGLTIPVEGFLLTGKAVGQVQTTEPTQSLINVQSIEILGNTVFEDSELEAIVAPLLGQKVTLEKLLEVQKEIDNYYVSKGYRNSGSVLLPQEIDGIIRIQIIEGTLEAIEIKGLKNLSENYLKSRLPTVGKPLNFNHLLQSLGRLENDPLIKKIDAEINQKSPGKNILIVNLEEDSSWDAKITIIDGYSRSIGSFGGNIKITNKNLLGFGDRLSIDSSLTEGLGRIGLSYSFPVNKLDSRIILAYNNANSELVKDEVKPLGIEAD